MCVTLWRRITLDMQNGSLQLTEDTRETAWHCLALSSNRRGSAVMGPAQGGSAEHLRESRGRGADRRQRHTRRSAAPRVRPRAARRPPARGLGAWGTPSGNSIARVDLGPLDRIPPRRPPPPPLPSRPCPTASTWNGTPAFVNLIWPLLMLSFGPTWPLFRLHSQTPLLDCLP